MAVGAAEGFGDFDRFVDDDRIRRFGHRTQFVAGHQQDAALNRVDVFFIAVEQGADDLHVFRAVAVRAEKQGGEQIGICTFEVGGFADVFRHFGCGGVVQGCLIEGLDGEFAGAAAGAGFHIGFLSDGLSLLVRRGRS